MTNITAAIILTLSTNWVPVSLPDGKTEEVGIVIESQFAEVIYHGKTNRYLQAAYIIGQPYTRDQQANLSNFNTNIWGRGVWMIEQGKDVVIQWPNAITNKLLR